MSKLNKADRADFAGYCRTLSDAQVRGAVEKEERIAREGDAEYHGACAEVARLELEKRGLS